MVFTIEEIIRTMNENGGKMEVELLTKTLCKEHHIIYDWHYEKDICDLLEENGYSVISNYVMPKEIWYMCIIKNGVEILKTNKFGTLDELRTNINYFLANTDNECDMKVYKDYKEIAYVQLLPFGFEICQRDQNGEEIILGE